MELSFGEIGEWLPVEVAGTVEPFLVLLGGEGADEAQAACVVGEPSGARQPAAGSPQGSAGGRWQHAHDEGTALEFPVEAFEQVGAFAVFVMGLGEAVEGEGFFDLLFDPGGEFGVFDLPVFEPGGEVLPGAPRRRAGRRASAVR